MGYKVVYEGPQIDEALLRTIDIASRINGWVKMPTTLEKPLSLDTLKTPGNYLVEHWEDGPATNLVGPINLCVLTINGSQRIQMTEYLTERYMRTYDRINEKWGPWTLLQSDTQIYISPTAPGNPGDKTVWLDTSNPNSPVFKVYLMNPDGTAGNWIVVKPPNMMDTDVYDPNGVATDIFKYIDDAIGKANLESIMFDFSEHINNAEIHVTAEDKERWNKKPLLEEVNEYLEQLRLLLEADVINEAGNMRDLINELYVNLQKYKGILEAHIANIAIHPNAIKQEYWDSKADSNHTHHLDGKVTIDASQILTGIISPDRIDPSAKEIVVKVENQLGLSQITSEQAQNGDMVWQKEGTIIYYVVDDSLLGTPDYMKGLKLYSAGVVVLSWENITDKPTTLGGYGIIDAYTREEIDARLLPLEQIIEKYRSLLESLADFAAMDATELLKRVQEISLKQDSLIETHDALQLLMADILRLSLQLELLLS